jgi:hypothetical protein
MPPLPLTVDNDAHHLRLLAYLSGDLSESARRIYTQPETIRAARILDEIRPGSPAPGRVHDTLDGALATAFRHWSTRFSPHDSREHEAVLAAIRRVAETDPVLAELTAQPFLRRAFSASVKAGSPGHFTSRDHADWDFALARCVPRLVLGGAIAHGLAAGDSIAAGPPAGTVALPHCVDVLPACVARKAQELFDSERSRVK